MLVFGLCSGLLAKRHHRLLGLGQLDQIRKAQLEGGCQLEQFVRTGEIGALHPVRDGLPCDTELGSQILLCPPQRLDGVLDIDGVDNFVHRLWIIGAHHQKSSLIK